MWMFFPAILKFLPMHRTCEWTARIFYNSQDNFCPCWKAMNTSTSGLEWTSSSSSSSKPYNTHSVYHTKSSTIQIFNHIPPRGRNGLHHYSTRTSTMSIPWRDCKNEYFYRNLRHKPTENDGDLCYYCEVSLSTLSLAVLERCFTNARLYFTERWRW
jgi:hypothetical protein